MVRRHRRRDDGVAVVELDVPTEDVDDPRDGLRPFEQLEEGRVEADEIEPVERLAGLQLVLGPKLRIEPVGGFREFGNQVRRQHIAHDQVAAFVEMPTFVVGEAVL